MLNPQTVNMVRGHITFGVSLQPSFRRTFHDSQTSLEPCMIESSTLIFHENNGLPMKDSNLVSKISKNIKAMILVYLFGLRGR